MAVPKLRFKADDGSQFSDWEEHKIKEFVTESNILGHTGKEAKKLTVKLWAKGVVPKENVFSGSENTQYYIRHSGQLMYGKLDFLNCAFGIVPPELDGYESTLDAPAFDMHDISDKFLLSYVTRKIFYKKNGDIANGSRKAKRIHPDVFGEMPIMVPSLPEQQKIAEFLSTIDTVIAKQKETVSAWEERKKGVMQKLFSQEVRFKADDGSNFPEWEKKPFGDIVSEFKVKTKVENEDTLLSCAINGVFLNSELFGHQRGQSNIGYLKIKKGTLILSAQNLHLGNANVNLRFEHGIISPAYKTYDIVGCSAEYMSQWVKWDMTNQFFYNATTVGASECRRNVDWNMLYSQLFAVPCLAEQRKIADCLSSLDEVIEKQKATLAAWEELKKGLLQQMFV